MRSSQPPITVIVKDFEQQSVTENYHQVFIFTGNKETHKLYISINTIFLAIFFSLCQQQMLIEARDWESWTGRHAWDGTLRRNGKAEG